MGKVFVEINAQHCLDGKIKPLAIKWPDGRNFEIDKIIDARTAASLKGGGQGMRYTCRICAVGSRPPVKIIKQFLYLGKIQLVY